MSAVIQYKPTSKGISGRSGPIGTYVDGLTHSGSEFQIAPISECCHLVKMSMQATTELTIHIAQDDETGRWYVAESELLGLRLEASDPATLIRRIQKAAPELIELNALEIAAQHGFEIGQKIRLTPVFDSPLQLAA
jgi:Domain of unknown function (DUF1902)